MRTQIFIAALWSWSTAIAPAHQHVRDPKDQIFVDLALSAGVSALVSGVADLLALNDQFNRMNVLTPAEFHAVVHLLTDPSPQLVCVGSSLTSVGGVVIRGDREQTHEIPIPMGCSAA